MNTLVATIEDGSIYYDSHTGNWTSETGIDYLTSVFEDELGWILEEEPDVREAVEKSKLDKNKTFTVTLIEPHWVHDEGYWDMNYGYVNPESHVEWENIDVREAIVER